MSHKKDQLPVGDLHKQNICMSHKKDQLSVGDLHNQNICMSHKKDQLSVGDIFKTEHMYVSQKRSVICW